jgi:hypothetical protein
VVSSPGRQGQNNKNIVEWLAASGGEGLDGIVLWVCRLSVATTIARPGPNGPEKCSGPGAGWVWRMRKMRNVRLPEGAEILDGVGTTENVWRSSGTLVLYKAVRSTQLLCV